MNILHTPFTEEQTRSLTAGDIIYLSGSIYTARDQAHKRILEYVQQNKELPFSLENQVLYHCGPLYKEQQNSYTIISAGPTTSARMNTLTPPLLENCSLGAVIGKGGMDKTSHTSMIDKGCVYLATPGGLGAQLAKKITSVYNVYWPDLGLPEAVWHIEVNSFGPCIVAMDAKGNNLFHNVNDTVKKTFDTMFGEAL